MLSKRQVDIIKLILKHPDGIYSAKLCEELNVSSRTIRNDIVSINSYLTNNQCMIHSSKKIGYFIVSESYDRVKECLNVIEAIDHKKIASSSTERKYYILGRLLFEETINISDLSDELYVAEATIYKDVHSFIHEMAEKYFFHVLFLENGVLKINTDEAKLRSLIYRLIKDEIGNDNKLMNLYLYQLFKDVLDMDELNNIVEYLFDYCDVHLINVPDCMIYCVAWMVYFTSVRIDCSYQLNLQSTKNDNIWIKKVSNDLQLNFNDADCELIEPYINTIGIGITQKQKENDQDIIQEFIAQIYIQYSIDLLSMPSLVESLNTHLIFAIKRLQMDYQLRNPLLKDVKMKYAFAYEIALLIVPLVQEKYGKLFEEDEISYLALYIEPFLQAQKHKVRILIVNETSLGYVHLIENWLYHEFKDKIEVVGFSGIHALEETIKTKKVDLVISATLIESKLPAPIVNIFYLPTEKDRDIIERVISSFALRIQGMDTFDSVFEAENILFIDDDDNYDNILYKCSKNLEKKGYIDDADSFAKGCIEREMTYPTHIANGCYMPHPLFNQAKKNAICIAVNRNSEEQKLFFVSAFEPRIVTELQLVYNLIGIVAETPSLIDWILKANTNLEVMDCLRDIIKMM